MCGVDADRGEVIELGSLLREVGTNGVLEKVAELRYGT